MHITMEWNIFSPGVKDISWDLSRISWSGKKFPVMRIARGFFYAVNVVETQQWQSGNILNIFLQDLIRRGRQSSTLLNFDEAGLRDQPTFYQRTSVY